MNTDYIYWTFSSAAQSISFILFIALLLAGYALVHNLMEAARDKDDGWRKSILLYRSVYHKRLTVLAWLTGCAVILSLVVVYLNRSNEAVVGWVLFVVGALDLLAVIGGVAFVVSIVDPRKYQKAAEKVLEQVQVISGISQVTPASEFFDAFLHLERLIRDYLKSKDLYVPSRGAQRMSYSFRQMIDALLQNEVIDRVFLNELLEINKYRNLVFHGHVSNADENMVQRVRTATERLKKLL